MTFSSFSTPAFITLQVTDTGSGISSDDLPYVFDRFYRANKARTFDNNSSGLGLAICQSIIHAHNGSIHIDSQQDKGTQVTISLPVRA